MKFIFIVLSLFFNLPASAQVCRPDEVYVRPHARDSYQKRDGTIYSAADVVGYCRQKSQSATLVKHLKNGKPVGWPHKNEKFVNWTKDEIELLVKALANLPIKISSLPIFFRAKTSIVAGNPAASMSGIIVLYDKAFDNSIDLSRIIVHELAHELYRSKKPLELREYESVAKWIRLDNSDKPFRVGRSQFVAPDGDQSPDEDFANNLEFYVYEPLKLKLKNPEIYVWFEIGYGDKIKKKQELK
jgi:hypothetical protein